ncbi:hypothetical protein ACRAWF_07975 [Streptomyces sp. L7]
MARPIASVTGVTAVTGTGRSGAAGTGPSTSGADAVPDDFKTENPKAYVRLATRPPTPRRSSTPTAPRA